MASKFGGVAVDEIPSGSKFGGVTVEDTEIKPAPKTEPKTPKPSLPTMFTTAPEPQAEAAGAAAAFRGLSSSLLGAPGALFEYFTPEAKDPKLRGAETVLPSPESIKLMYEKMGYKEPKTEVLKAAQFGGEIAPLAVAGAKGIYDLSKFGITKATDLAKRLTGSKDVAEAKKAVEKLQTSLPSTLSEAEKIEITNRARQEKNLREAKSKFLGKAQEQREAASRKFADLGAPSETQALGTEMQRRLTGTQFTREARASQQAARDYQKYFEQAKGFENSAAREVMLQQLEAMSASPSVGSAGRKYASQALKDLKESETALGAEKEFRKYFEQATAPQQAGYGAIEQQANRDVSDIISKALNDHAPYRITTRNTYKEYQTPLDAYETLFGQKGVKREKAVPDRLQMMATDYPSNYFKNKDTINALREQLAGDEAAVRKFANQHAVNELQGKTGSQAADWLKKNSEWINSVEGLNTRVSRYVDSLKNAELQATKLEEQAKKIGSKVQDVIGVGENRAAKLSEFKEQLNLYPEKAPSVANNMIDYLSQNKLLPPEKLKLLKADVDAANKLKDALQRQKELRKAFIYYGVITAGGGYGTYKLGQGIFKE